jgi:Protein of unknown function (DUF2934)
VKPDQPERRASRLRNARQPVVDPFPSSDEIAERAHILWVADGRRPDRVIACWRHAEDELLDRAARRTVG